MKYKLEVRVIESNTKGYSVRQSSGLHYLNDLIEYCKNRNIEKILLKVKIESLKDLMEVRQFLDSMINSFPNS